MEPLKGGNLVNKLPKEAIDLIKSEGFSPADLGLRYVASLDNVAIVLSGMGTELQTRENANSLTIPYKLEEKGYEIIEKILEFMKESQQIECTNCGYCLDECPKDIPINGIFDLVNNETKNGKIINRNARLFYNGTVSGRGKASDCISCGKCEDVCSQRLSVRAELERAAVIFERKPQ